MLSVNSRWSREVARRCRRWHSSYEYPLRTEAPVVSRTLAKDVVDENSYFVTNEKLLKHSDGEDHYDSRGSMSNEERKETLRRQRLELETAPPGSRPIGETVPSNIPPNVSQGDLVAPVTEETTLPNGLRVASQETYGQVTTVGVLINSGSRYETVQSTGANYMLELLAFSSNDNDVFVQELGGATFASSSREQFLYCIDILRPSVPQALKTLAQSVMHLPTEEQLDQVKRVVEYQYMDMMPEVLLGEGLQMAAYGPIQKPNENAYIQQLGRPHLCKSSQKYHGGYEILSFSSTFVFLCHYSYSLIDGALGSLLNYFKIIIFRSFRSSSRPRYGGYQGISPNTFFKSDRNGFDRCWY